jgi:hypothetical protein
MDFLNHRKVGREGSGFQSIFLLSTLQCTVTHCRNYKRLREFEEMEISRQSCKGDFEYQ